MPFIDKYPYTDIHEMNLDWIISQVKKLGYDVTGLTEELNRYENDVNAQLEILNNWIDNYTDEWAKTVIEKYLATMIFVEINEAGYIIYYIPDSWSEIDFNTTGLDITIPNVEYGHLVLSY